MPARQEPRVDAEPHCGPPAVTGPHRFRPNPAELREALEGALHDSGLRQARPFISIHLASGEWARHPTGPDLGREHGGRHAPRVGHQRVEPARVGVQVGAFSADSPDGLDIRTLDLRASGVFGVDLRQDADGVARVTEINAGRFSSTTNLLDLTGKHNMTAVYLALALGQPVELRDEYEVAEFHYLLRDIDAVPQILREEEFFDGVYDARHATRQKEPTC